MKPGPGKINNLNLENQARNLEPRKRNPGNQNLDTLICNLGPGNKQILKTTTRKETWTKKYKP